MIWLYSQLPGFTLNNVDLGQTFLKSLFIKHLVRLERVHNLNYFIYRLWDEAISEWVSEYSIWNVYVKIQRDILIIPDQIVLYFSYIHICVSVFSLLLLVIHAVIYSYYFHKLHRKIYENKSLRRFEMFNISYHWKYVFLQSSLNSCDIWADTLFSPLPTRKVRKIHDKLHARKTSIGNATVSVKYL